MGHDWDDMVYLVQLEGTDGKVFTSPNGAQIIYCMLELTKTENPGDLPANGFLIAPPEGKHPTRKVGKRSYQSGQEPVTHLLGILAVPRQIFLQEVVFRRVRMIKMRQKSPPG